jgi:hypothetical protein
VKSTSATVGGWVAFGILCALASLLWFMDNEVLLRSLQPGSAWITVAVMWVEIGALIGALIRRYRRRSQSLGLAVAVAAGALLVNGVGVVILLPAIVLG